MVKDYETARERAARKTRRMPELSGIYVARLHYANLPEDIRRQVPQPEDLRFDFKTPALNHLVIK